MSTCCKEQSFAIADAEPAGVPVAEIEGQTGLTKEVIRKWESRYGFPCPQRDLNGDRVYPADQVASLRLIRRLLGAGMRPARIVGLDRATLEQLAEGQADATPAVQRTALDLVARHDIHGLQDFLRGLMNREGLGQFVRTTLAGLHLAVGEAWLRGEIRVFEEHLYSQAVIEILQECLRSLTPRSGSPAILLTTAPGELHTLGLMMADATFSLEAAKCVRLGAQTPASEVAAAARGCGIDIVALSFSAAHPRRDVARYLRDLRGILPPAIEIWVGGAGIARLRRMAGVRMIDRLDDVAAALQDWRQRAAARE